MGLSHSPSIVTDGLVLCLDAANPRSYPGSGTSWLDLSGQGNNGTLTNGPIFSSSNGGSIVFDGVDDRARLSSLTLPSTGVFTVSMIFALTGNSGRGGFFERKVLSPYNGFSLGQGGSNNWSATLSGTSNFANYVSVSFTYPTLNVIYHDAAVYNGSTTLTAYRNGEYVSSTTGIDQGNLDTQGTRENNIGARSSTEELPCKIYLIKVYNRALTADEVRRNYLATKSRFNL